MVDLGRFSVVRELGRGGMGVVYEVRDPALPGRALALKLLQGGVDPSAVARFAREAQALARVHHRGVVPVHSLDRTPAGEPYLLTDLVPGRDLAAVVATSGRPAPREAAALVRDLADAVRAAHAVGVVHRDLKPSNVLIRADGSPVLIDFGLAHVAEGSRLTETGTILGTPAYMAPEQALGGGVDERTDVYGLGALLYWLLVGRAPFAGAPLAVLHAVVHRDPDWPRAIEPSLPAGLDALCRRAMAKDPAARPQSAAALRDELARWVEGAEREAGSRLGRRGALAALGALVVVAGLALAAAPGRAPPLADTPAATRAPGPEAAPTASLAQTSSPRAASEEGHEVRRRWAGRVWSEGDLARPVTVRFLDDRRLATLPTRGVALAIHSLASRQEEARVLLLEHDDGGGMAMVRVRPGLLLLVTPSCLWSSDGVALTPLWRPPADTALFEWLAFERATGRVVVTGRHFRPTWLRLEALPATATAPEQDVETLRFGFELYGGRLLEALRPPGGGGALRSSAPGQEQGWATLPPPASAALHPDAPLLAVGLQRAGQIALLDVSEPEPRRVALVRLDYRQLPATGTQVHACAFGAGRLWVATPHALWSWPVQPEPLLAARTEQQLGAPPDRRVDMLPAGFGEPCSIDLSPDGALVAVGGRGQVLLRGVDAP